MLRQQWIARALYARLGARASTAGDHQIALPDRPDHFLRGVLQLPEAFAYNRFRLPVALRLVVSFARVCSTVAGLLIVPPKAQSGAAAGSSIAGSGFVMTGATALPR